MTHPIITSLRTTKKRDKVQFREHRSSQFIVIKEMKRDLELDSTASDMLSDYIHPGLKYHFAYMPTPSTLVR